MVDVRESARQDGRPPAPGDGAGAASAPPGRHPGSPRPSTVRPSTTGSVGLLLAGRYRLDERRGRDGDSSTWDGHDEQLDRPVLVRVVSGAAVAPTLVAARAAALHLDPALARILDTGSARATDGTLLAWVVEERPAGQRLGDLVRARAMDADDARVVLAGAAAALARAAALGHHHRRLGPASLYVRGRDVVVSGLLVAAAAAGLEGVEHERAEREDAVGLVCLLYAALSGLWPYARLEALGAAPRTRGGAVPLRDLAPSTPADLDALAAQTLGPLHGGPLSPADLVMHLMAPRQAPPGRDVDLAAPAQVVLPATPPGPRAGPPPGQPLGAAVAQAEVGAPPAAAPQGGEPEGTAVTGAAAGRVRSPRRAARAARGRRDEQAQDAPGPARTRELAAVPAVTSSGPPAVPGDGATAPIGGGAAPIGGGAAVPARGEAGSVRRGAGRGAAVTGAREAFERSRTRARAVAAVAVSWREDRAGGTGEQEALPVARPPAAGRVRSPLGGAARAVVAALVAAALVVAVVVAWRALPSLPSLITGAGAAAPASPSGAAQDAPAPPAAPAPASGQAPAVSGVRALDPDGDGRENDDRLPALLDDDPGTSWASETYASASFGGLKPGVGIVLDLAAGSTVSAVDLRAVGSGGTVEVRTSADGSLEGSAVVATGPLGGDTSITLPAPAQTSHVVLWVTRLPSAPEGYRAELSGVALR